VPKLIAAVVEPGTLAVTEQPVLRVDDELTLRPFRVDDANDVDAVVTAFSTPDIQYFHFRHLDHDEARQWIEECGEGWRSERSATWAIVQQPDAQVVGRVTVYCSLAEGHGEVSYWVLPAARQRGVASRACVTATRWAHDVGLHRIELQHSATNDGSGRVAVRAGFRREGIRRGATLHADGWHDMVLYAHLASDPA
jgi:RimJ/RimL family protein N-acetyltransferase